MAVLQSLIADRWIGSREGAALASAIDGATIHHAHADEIDFGEALAFARRTGGASLLALDFQQRAARLKALAAYLNERKEELYAISRHTGATRSDGWVDIEGGTGTLYAYASMGGNELPSGNVLHEGPPVVLGKKGQFAATHILVPRGGVAVHINAFNFPVWGLLDRLESSDVVTFTGSADTALKLRSNPNLLARSIPFNAEADSLNAAVLGPDVGPDDEEFDLFAKEVAREMTVKAGQKCTAIRRAIVPRRHLDAMAARLRDRLAKVSVGDPALEGVKMGALASKAQQADVAERLALLAKGNEIVFGAADGFAPKGEGVANGAFFAPTLVLCRDGVKNDAVHDV